MRFQISTVKDKDAQLGSEPVDYNAIGKAIAKLVVLYMVSDTLRKIIIHTVATKIN